MGLAEAPRCQCGYTDSFVSPLFLPPFEPCYHTEPINTAAPLRESKVSSLSKNQLDKITPPT